MDSGEGSMKVCNLSYCLKNGWKNLEEAKNLDSKDSLIIVFAAPEFHDHPEIFKELKSYFPKSSLVGCSTSGEIFGAKLSDSSLAISIIHFENSHFSVSASEIKTSGQSLAAGSKLIEDLEASDLRGVLILSDGLLVNGSELSKGINQKLEASNIVVSGGLAGDGNQFQKTWTLKEEQILENTIIAIGFYGENLKISNASKGGWDVFGPERVVTKSDGNILYEIDGQPALDLYKNYLGERANELPASGLLFPLQIRSNHSDQNKLVRTLLAVDELTKSMTFAGDVPEGCLTQFLRANFEHLIDAAGEAAEQIQNGDENSFAMAVSCVGRRIALGQRVEEELEAVQSSLGENANVIGFYSYGEIGPKSNSPQCDLHNQTMTIFNIKELKNAA